MDGHLIAAIIYFINPFVGLGLASTIVEPDSQGDLLSRVST